MNIAITYSPNWARHVMVEVFALFATSSSPVKVYLISDDLGRLDLSSMCAQFGPGYSCEFISVEKLYSQRMQTANVCGRFTKYTLYKLLIPELADVDRLIFLDADAIANGDLTALWNTRMGSNVIAGVVDSGADRYNLKRPLGLTPADDYINAGVMLMDLKQIRSEGIGQQWIAAINKKSYPANDQDVINLTCKGRIKTVDAKYNQSLSTDLKSKDIRIMHYAGQKPWDTPDTPHPAIWKHWQERFNAESNLPIPKRIHYCWFGGAPKPELVEKCLASWMKHLPEFEIVEWNENNFDVTSNPYTAEAYRTGRLAFVTDYVRLWALHNFGGIYMDSDVEVLKPLDRFLEHRAFTGHETPELLITATMGAVPSHPWIQHLLSYYDTATLDEIPNTQTITRMSWPLIEKKDGETRYLEDGVVVYPVDTFCPFDHQRLRATPTEDSYAVHHFAGSWTGRSKTLPPPQSAPCGYVRSNRFVFTEKVTELGGVKYRRGRRITLCRAKEMGLIP